MTAKTLEDWKKEAVEIGAPIEDNWGAKKVQAAIDKRKKELNEELAPAEPVSAPSEPAPADEPVAEVAAIVEPEPVAPASKSVTIANKSAAPITLIGSAKVKGAKVTILPTGLEAVSGEFMADIEANKAAMTYFESGDLVKV